MILDREQRAEELFERALGLARAEREAMLRATCAENAELHSYVAELLNADAADPGFLEESPTLIADFLVGARTPDPAGDLPGDATSKENDALRAGSHIGGYELLREIGRGAMGVVWTARQLALGREVALKWIPTRTCTPASLERFQREAEAGARIDHPGVVAVHDVGRAGDVAFIAQELVPGARTLARHIADIRRLSELPAGHDRCTVELFVQVAEALDAAHARGVVHRDIKPANILLTPEGRPRIVDFGVAWLEGAPGLSLTGQIIGTPAYMSPEQAEGRRRAIDPRSDVFSLGATIYEALVLVRPFEGDRRADVLRRIATEPAPDPRLVRGSLPRDLAAICLKALERQPHRRYGTMAELAADLRAFLRAEPVRARPPGPLRRAAYRIRRHPVLAASIAIVALTTGATALQGWRAASLRDEILRLSDAWRLEVLTAAAEDLGPALPENAQAYDEWLQAAGELQARLDLHRRTLSRLRARAAEWTDEQRARDRATFPDQGLLERRTARREDLQGVMETLRTVATWSEVWSQERERLEDHLARLDGEIAADEAQRDLRRTWTLAATEEQWRHDRLAALIGALEAFFEPTTGLAALVRRRRDFATSLEERTIGAPSVRERWHDAIESIADTRQCPAYEGLRIGPQLGLVPIGRDPQSGLWEFGHLLSGPPTRRDPESGRLGLRPENGLVLVLIPGGNFWMGSQGSDPDGQNHDPYPEPTYVEREAPVHLVRVRPFFLSKYEMTQGQWERASGTNPSRYPVHILAGGHLHTALHPVESATWEECVRELGTLDLELPSEEQWEYAARAGTSTPWWAGSGPDELVGAVNIADRSARQTFAGSVVWPEYDDGYLYHAPVAHYRPNRFGLHSMLGNVEEWCGNPFAPYASVGHDAGKRTESRAFEERVGRGGAFASYPVQSRCASRNTYARDLHYDFVGLRPCRALREP